MYKGFLLLNSRTNPKDYKFFWKKLKPDIFKKKLGYDPWFSCYRNFLLPNLRTNPTDYKIETSLKTRPNKTFWQCRLNIFLWYQELQKDFARFPRIDIQISKALWQSKELEKNA